jgi:hypothetical protein
MMMKAWEKSESGSCLVFVVRSKRFQFPSTIGRLTPGQKSASSVPSNSKSWSCCFDSKGEFSARKMSHMTRQPGESILSFSGRKEELEQEDVTQINDKNFEHR